MYTEIHYHDFQVVTVAVMKLQLYQTSHFSDTSPLEHWQSHTYMS
jgi:hypothetical protein